MTTKVDLEAIRQTAPLGFTPECFTDSQGNTVDDQRAIIDDSTYFKPMPHWELGVWRGPEKFMPDWYRAKLGEQALTGANQQPDTLPQETSDQL